MTKKGHQKIFRIEQKAFGNLVFAAHAAADFLGPAVRRRQPKLTGVPPATLTSVHGST